MDCTECSSLLSEHLAGCLSPEQKQHMECHLAGCPACARELVAEARIDSALSTRPLDQPLAGFTARVLSRTHPQPARRSAWWWATPIACAVSVGSVSFGLARALGSLRNVTLPVDHAARAISRVSPAIPDGLVEVAIGLAQAPGQVLAAIGDLLGALSIGVRLADLPPEAGVAAIGAVVCLISATWACLAAHSRLDLWQR